MARAVYGAPRMTRTIRRASVALAIAGVVLGSPEVAFADPTTAAADAPSSDASLDARLAPLFERGGLRSDDVAARAVATDADVSAKRAGVAAAAAAVDQVIAAYLPRVTLSARYARLSSTDAPSLGNIVAAPTAPAGPIAPGTRLVNVPLAIGSAPLNQYVATASISVPLSDYVLRLTHGFASAQHSERAAKLGVDAAKRHAASDARLAYYGWARARLQRAVAEQALDQAKLHLADAESAFEVGTASKADVLRVRSQVAQSELLAQRGKNLEEASAELLRTAMHDRDEVTYEIGEDLRRDAPGVSGAADPRALLADAIERRPEIRALDESAWSLERQAQAIRASYLPRVDAVGDLTYANPNSRAFPQKAEFTASWSAGVVLTWVVSDIPGAAAQKAGVEANAAKVAAERRGLVDALRKEIAQARQALLDAQAAVATSRAGLAAAEESYRVRRELFKAGRATSAELTDAELDLTQARLEAIGARVDARMSRVRLLHAIGRDGGAS